jgi:flagellar biosynthesis/type III secretory pathway protein FliH
VSNRLRLIASKCTAREKRSSSLQRTEQDSSYRNRVEIISLDTLSQWGTGFKAGLVQGYQAGLVQATKLFKVGQSSGRSEQDSLIAELQSKLTAAEEQTETELSVDEFHPPSLGPL